MRKFDPYAILMTLHSQSGEVQSDPPNHPCYGGWRGWPCVVNRRNLRVARL